MRVPALAKFLEHLPHVLGRNANSGIGDAKCDTPVRHPVGERRRRTTRQSEFESVGQQIDYDLLERPPVGAHRR
jgi:hypothetical protein